MPIYEFRCNECNNLFEALILKKEEKISCPKCKGSNVERLMSAFAYKSGDNFSSSSDSSCST